MEQENSLLDIENEINFEPATTGHRFANYLIDTFIFYIVFTAVMISIVFMQANYESQSMNPLALYPIIFIVYVSCFTFFEGVSKGRSVGKWITGTKAVKENGSNISWRDALLRSMSRLVPFEPFSAFGGYPWHDRWTNTKVVKIRK